MRNRKKRIALYLIVGTIVSGIIIATTVTLSTKRGEENALYVYTTEAPEEIIAYAEEVFPDFFHSLLVNNGIAAPDNYYLGYPLSLPSYANPQDVFYHFAVISDYKIYAILTVLDNGIDKSAQLEDNLMVKKLNLFIGKTSIKSPLTFISNDNGLYIKLDNQIESLIPGMKDYTNNNPTDIVHGGNVVNILLA